MPIGSAMRRNRTRRLWRARLRNLRATRLVANGCADTRAVAIADVAQTRFIPELATVRAKIVRPVRHLTVLPAQIAVEYGRGAAMPRNIPESGRLGRGHEAAPAESSGMGENVLRGPAGEVEPRAIGQEAESRPPPARCGPRAPA